MWGKADPGHSLTLVSFTLAGTSGVARTQGE